MMNVEREVKLDRKEIDKIKQMCGLWNYVQRKERIAGLFENGS